MAQVVISQKIKRTCDGCGKDFEYELIGERPDAEIDELFAWFTLIREVADPESGRMAKLMVQAHSLECVPAAACKIAVTPQSVNEGVIDISSLQVNKHGQEN